jgi:hypothetical protein
MAMQRARSRHPVPCQRMAVKLPALLKEILMERCKAAGITAGRSFISIQQPGLL